MKRSGLQVLRRNRGISAFIAVWCAAVSFGACQVGGGLVRQLRTGGYARTAGVITRSELEAIRGPDGTAYLPKLEYRYTVDGHGFTSDVLRHDAYSTRERDYHERVRAGFPLGAQVPVYFDPEQPQRAVLVRGDFTGVAFMAVFFAPFLYSLVLIGWLATRSWRLQCGEPAAAGLPRQRRGSTQRVRLDDQFALLPGALACGAMVLVALVDMVVVRPHGPALGHAIALALQCGAPLIAHALHRKREWLVIDAAAQRVERTAPEPVAGWSCAFHDVVTLWVEERSRGAHVGDSVHRFALMLGATRASADEPLEIAEFSSAVPAHALRAWLAREVRAEPIPVRPVLSVRPPGGVRDDVSEPYVARGPAPRTPALLVVAISSAFTLPLLTAALIAVTRLVLGSWQASDSWLLFAGFIGLLSVRGWWRGLSRLQAHEHVLYADRNGLSWDLEHRGPGLPQARGLGPSHGHIAFDSVALIADERGRGHDQLELRLKGGECVRLPREVTPPGRRKALLRWLERELPQLGIERSPVRICEPEW